MRQYFHNLWLALLGQVDHGVYLECKVSKTETENDE